MVYEFVTAITVITEPEPLLRAGPDKLGRTEMTGY
jgi:hypothetical protein